MTKIVSGNERAALAAMNAAAADGTLFARPTTDPARACWHALLACGDARLRKIAKDAEALAVRVSSQKKFSAMTADDIRAKSREAADEPYSQIVYEYDLEHRAAEAVKLLPDRADFAALAAESKAAADAMRAEDARCVVEFQRRQAEHEAKIAPHREAAKAAIDAECRCGTPSCIPSVDDIAEAIADGKDGREEARARYDARKQSEGPDVPDTFGYAHGTDFEGGEW